MQTKVTVLGQVVKSLLGSTPSRVSYCESSGVRDGSSREQRLRASIDRMRGKLFSTF